MTAAPASPRPATAGVTLVEMLVVLALFAVVSGAVVMALPSRQSGLSAEVSAASLASDIEHAMGVALADGQGFAILIEDNHVRFLHRSGSGEWQPHSDPLLAMVKLFPVGVRIFGQDGTANAIFALSPALVPDQSAPLRLAFGDEKTGSMLTYDGTAVLIDHGEGQ